MIGVLRGRRGTNRKVSSWGTVVPKGFLAESAFFSSRIRLNQKGYSRIKGEFALHQRRPALRENSEQALIRLPSINKLIIIIVT